MSLSLFELVKSCRRWSPCHVDLVGAVGGDVTSSYVIEAGSSSGLADLAMFDTGSVQVMLSVDGVPVGAYFVRVRAPNAAGISGASNEIIVRVGATCSGPPAAPTGLAATVVDRTFTLTWNAAAEALSYFLEAGSSPGASDLAAFDTGSTATGYTHSTDAGNYYLRVRARNGCGMSAPSNEIVVTIVTHWSIAFRPSLDTQPCGLPASSGFCSQTFTPDRSGAIGERWVTQSGDGVIAQGTITPERVTLRLQCVSGATSGVLSAAWDGRKYMGSVAFGSRTSAVRIEKGTVDPQCLIP